MSLLDPVQVEVYGQNMPLNQLATVSAPESRMLSVQVWDKSSVNAVDRAIRAAGLGLNPIVDGKLIRIPLPDMSRERRLEFVKTCHKLAEDGRVHVRNVRRDALEAVKKAKLPEDEAKRLEKDIQAATDKSIKDIGDHLAHKEKDLLTV